MPKDNSVVYAFCKIGDFLYKDNYYYTTALYLNNAIDKEAWYAKGIQIDKDIIAWTELPEYKEE